MKVHRRSLPRNFAASIIGVLLMFGINEAFAAGLSAFKIENPQSGYPTQRFGYSVAIDGDTMVVGAPDDPFYYPANKDVARVYVSNGSGGWYLQQELIAADAGDEDEFGLSVSISGDTVVVGAAKDDDQGLNSGSAYVFVRNGSSWSQQAKLNSADGAAGDQFGWSVSVSGDTILAGANWDYDEVGHWSNAGSAYVFTRNGFTWTQQAKIRSTDTVGDDQFGYSVSLSGETAIIGAPYSGPWGGESGSAYVFTRNGSTWSKQAKLSASDGVSGAWFGYSVSISGDMALIGASGDDDKGFFAGSAYVFSRNGSAWTQQAKLIATDGVSGDLFGSSVSIDGDTAIVGVSGDENYSYDPGSAYIFKRNGSGWTQAAQLSDGGSRGWFGCSVSVSGESAAVGAYGDDSLDYDAGAVYVFAFNGSGWIQQAKVVASESAGNDYFGSDVAISGDTAVLGAQGDDDCGGGSGSAYVYARLGSAWVQKQKLTAADAAPGDAFGVSVAISGNTMIIGANGDEDAGEFSGSAYIFAYDGSGWVQQAKLKASDAAAYDHFGLYVAVSGDTAVVGADANDHNGLTNCGAVYVFVRIGSTWVQQAKLTAADAAPADFFGTAVSISGNTVLVGANGDDDGGEYSGSAYVFTRNGSAWAQQAKLRLTDASLSDHFGLAVSVSGETAVVGVYGEDGPTEGNSGAAYVFTRNGSTWTQSAILTAPDRASDDSFGISVFACGDKIVVGAHGDDDGGPQSGSAYLFTGSGSNWTMETKLKAADPAEGDGFGWSVSVDSGRVLVGTSSKDDPETNSGAAYVFVPASDSAAHSGWNSYR